MIHEATRTLVKSPPELWAQCSDAEALARHLNGSFGEIRITRLEPETTVAWEGEHASGTVTIQPSAWGTRVTLTAQVDDEEQPDPPAETAVVASPESAPPESLRPEPAPLELLDPMAVEPQPLVEPKPLPAPKATAPDIATEPTPPSVPRSGRLAARITAWFRRSRAVPVPVPAAVPEVVDMPVEDLLSRPEPEPESENVAVDPSPAEPPAPDPPLAEPAAPEPSAPGPVAAEPGAPEPAAPEPSAPSGPAPSIDTVAALTAGLESLGQAHHRPYSRA